MADLILEPAAELGGAVVITQKTAAGQASAQRVLSFPNIDLETFDLVVFEQDAEGSWNPVASTVGMAEGSTASGVSIPAPPVDAYTKAESDASIEAVRQVIADLITGAPAMLDTLVEIAAWVQTDRAGVADLLSRVGTLEFFRRFLNTSQVNEGSNLYYTPERVDTNLGQYFGLNYTYEIGLPGGYQPSSILTAQFGESMVLPANNPAAPYRCMLPVTNKVDQISSRGGLIGFRHSGTSGTVTIALENGITVTGGKAGNGFNSTYTLSPGEYIKVARRMVLYGQLEKEYYVVEAGSTLGPAIATPTNSALEFTQDADYGVISSGTFTVTTTGARAGAVVRVELAPGCSKPVLDPTVFELISGTFQAGTRCGYGFSVQRTGKIEYFIYQKP